MCGKVERCLLPSHIVLGSVPRHGTLGSCIYQHHDQKLRSINVDSEWKTVTALKKNQLIRANNIIHGLCGRGNNWAMGYYGLNDPQEKDILQKTLQSVRKESERVWLPCGGTLT
eukprot:XP_014789293.1 PREDICTED: tubulin beta chain-like isoform X2 [Octopus bimaculoides]